MDVKSELHGETSLAMPYFHLFAFHNRNNLFLLYVFFRACEREGGAEWEVKEKFYLFCVFILFKFLDKQRAKLFIIFLISTFPFPIVCRDSR